MPVTQPSARPVMQRRRHPALETATTLALIPTALGILTGLVGLVWWTVRTVVSSP